MKQINKKGQVLQNLGALGVGIVTLTLVLVIVFLVMSQIQTVAVDSDAACQNSTLVYNATQNYCCTFANCTGTLPGTRNTSDPRAASYVMNQTQALTEATATIPGWAALVVLIGIGGIVLVMVSAFKRR